MEGERSSNNRNANHTLDIYYNSCQEYEILSSPSPVFLRIQGELMHTWNSVLFIGGGAMGGSFLRKMVHVRYTVLLLN